MKLSDLLDNETVKIGSRDISLLDLFNIDEALLSENMANQSAIYAYIGVYKIRLERARNEYKQKREEVYAELDLAYRAGYEEGKQKFTEASIKSCIITDDVYIQAQEDYNEAEERFLIFEMLIKALEMRANMLQSVGAFLRMENQMTGMYTKEFEEQIGRLKGKLRSKNS